MLPFPEATVERTRHARTEEADRSISPLAAPVHVRSGSAVVRIDNGVLVVEREGEPRFERPVELVSAVHIHGWATITSPCIAELVRQGTPVIWRGATGYPIGCASPMHQAGLEARRAQFAAVGMPRALAIARAIVAAKIVAGRQVTQLADGRSGLLMGWHDRSRACRVEDDGPIGTLLSLGICEMLGVIKGESFAFLELLDAIEGPAQIVFVPDDQLVPNTRVVAEQIRRTPDKHAAITQDLAASLAGGGVSPA